MKLWPVIALLNRFEIRASSARVTNVKRQSIMARNREFGRIIREVHQLAAYALVGLASIHAFAALWHHFIRKDTTLWRMLSGKR